MASSVSYCLCAFLMALCLASSASAWRRELTTRSLDAVGFKENAPHSPNEDQLIIAVLDSGILPDSPSFNDEGFGPPPAKWKGICDPGSSKIPFKCNNKIIGARVYISYRVVDDPNEDLSPRDTNGHGTHVAAIIAGVPVKNVSMGGTGIGLGTSRGVVPRARLAVYKICWYHSCTFMAKGMFDAIKDGADIISISTGVWPWPFGTDAQSSGSFAAVQNGIFVSFSAGNTGSTDSFTVGNVNPWITTVGNSAGSGTDYVTYVTLGDGKRFEGAYLNTEDDGKMMHPLILNEEVTNATAPDLITTCVPEYLNPETVKGKIIICGARVRATKWKSFDSLGLAGLLINGANGDYDDLKEFVSLEYHPKTPLISLKEVDFKYLLQYYNNSKQTGQTATANIAKTVSVPDSPPRVAVSSCRGPNLMDLNILKPDISAPGTNIVSAYVGNSSYYDGATGTSMSAPFLTGAAAYVKTFHPTWSPAAIKSALMTTARPMSDTYHNARELAYGTGQVDLLRATDPGLVYDIDPRDYVKYLFLLISHL